MCHDAAQRSLSPRTLASLAIFSALGALDPRVLCVGGLLGDAPQVFALVIPSPSNGEGRRGRRPIQFIMYSFPFSPYFVLECLVLLSSAEEAAKGSLRAARRVWFSCAIGCDGVCATQLLPPPRGVREGQAPTRACHCGLGCTYIAPPSSAVCPPSG